LQSKYGRYALLTALVAVLAIPAGAFATGEGRSLFGGQRNPSSGSLTRETQVIASNSSYGTRQSNKGTGGGAIYGCRADVASEPCIRASNLRGGKAFEFDTQGGSAGSITVKDTSGAPFTTNATGTVKNLSADTVDGKDSADLALAGDLLFAAVNADGTLVAGARGATASVKSNAAEQTYTVTFNRDVSKCSYSASPVGGSTDYTLGVSSGTTTDPATSKPANVVIDERNVADGNTAGRGFHLQVVC
jgi:hypothetical protein